MCSKSNKFYKIKNECYIEKSTHTRKCIINKEEDCILGIHFKTRIVEKVKYEKELHRTGSFTQLYSFDHMVKVSST